MNSVDTIGKIYNARMFVNFHELNCEYVVVKTDITIDSHAINVGKNIE